MHTSKITAAALVLMALSGMASPASAETHTYRVGANSTRTVALSLCSPVVWVGAEGDGDTDVDFDIYNPSSRNIHSDWDETDITYKTVQRTASGCSAYSLVMRNRGGVYNDVAVTVRDQ